MCGIDVDLDDGGEEGKEQEEECGMGSERVQMLPPPPAHSDAGAWGGRRGRGGCLAWAAALALWNVAVAAACVLIMAAVFALVLLPTVLLLYAGFLCHSRVLNSPSPVCRYLDDNSCSALIILGFVMMSPLVVVAAATFCGLAHRLHLFLLFQPMARARHRGGGWGWDRHVRAWV
ncbi:transmembrane protein 88B-like [Megalops cyprinoides]|uniref:transmembrane protein 88B-like n=1 Tax=Megalops cyprinoides TaxID=118141 RepID=UPI001864BE92|nr:transmembrane protein 88B-like [Megalops cyprinoides]